MARLCYACRMDETLTKREIGAAILRELFANRSRVPISEVVAAAQERGVSRRTLTRAGKELGITEIHNGPYGGFWTKEKQ